MFNPQRYKNELGEFVNMDYEKVVRFCLKHDGLEQIAQEVSEEMGFSVDAGLLASGTTYNFSGAKTMDMHATNKDGQLKSVEYGEDESQFYKNLQSNANVYIMCMAYSCDNKDPCKQFLGDWFKFIQKNKKEGLPYQDKTTQQSNLFWLG